MNELFRTIYPLAEFDWFQRYGMHYPVVVSFIIAWCFGIGACLGSFLNVCIWRIPRGESLSAKASHCGSCNTPIKWYDNIPIVTYIVLRGRCRSCKTHYSCRYLIVEALCGLGFVGIFLKVAFSGQPMEILANYAWMLLFAVGIAWIDAEHRIIPDKMNYSACIMAALFALVLPGAWGVTSPLRALMLSLFSGLVPGAFLAIFALAGKAVARTDVLGWGDVKYIIACGMLIGLPGAIFTVVAGSGIASVTGLIAAVIRRKQLRRMTIPFGPFLAGASLVWIFAGEYILRWYLLLAQNH